jgi:hypothetical protein
MVMEVACADDDVVIWVMEKVDARVKKGRFDT